MSKKYVCFTLGFPNAGGQRGAKNRGDAVLIRFLIFIG
ncbi:hypothetical protein MKMG_01074 [Methanogenium sp. MK-MG]|nr:hypothetical protein MKMG_01074 [Methanogenium sp. MK-MG]